MKKLILLVGAVGLFSGCLNFDIVRGQGMTTISQSDTSTIMEVNGLDIRIDKVNDACSVRLGKYVYTYDCYTGKLQ